MKTQSYIAKEDIWKNALNKRVSAKNERKARRAPHTPNINQHSASL